jgi:adenylate kinase family enzyme
VSTLSVVGMKRVAVIGCGGSGKTTLSRQLGALLGLPVVHIDAHYWRWVDGERVESPPAQWAERHRELVAGDRWIIDAMKLGVLGERLAAADTVIYLDVSTFACLSGILRRRIRFRCQVRPELGVYDRIDWQFVRWIVSFRRRHRPRLLELLGGFDGDLIVVTHRRRLKPLRTAVGGSVGSDRGSVPGTTRARGKPERYETGVR